MTKDKDVVAVNKSKKNSNATGKNLVPSKGLVDPLIQYINEINKYDLLSIDEEKELTQKLFETGDIEIARKLVVANLRLVVKIAFEYRNAYQNILDLIQEGNIGLMKAVSKYDPSKGAKLSYYASWWIKSYILKFILDNFRLIKIGTTAEQKKLFYNLMNEKERFEKLGIKPDPKQISMNLGVSEKAVIEMDKRLGSHGQEVSIDLPISRESDSTTLGDTIAGEEGSFVDEISHAQDLEILQDKLKDFMTTLKDRDQEIFKKRLLSEVQPSLQSIADDYGVSRERIRQIEERLLEKLKVYMSEHFS
jgi:RNA polymerase sigma-32 factor